MIKGTKQPLIIFKVYVGMFFWEDLLKLSCRGVEGLSSPLTFYFLVKGSLGNLVSGVNSYPHRTLFYCAGVPLL